MKRQLSCAEMIFRDKIGWAMIGAGSTILFGAIIVPWVCSGAEGRGHIGMMIMSVLAIAFFIVGYMQGFYPAYNEGYSDGFPAGMRYAHAERDGKKQPLPDY